MSNVNFQYWLEFVTDNEKMTQPEKDRNRDSKSGLNIVKEKPRVEMVDRGVGPSTPGPAPVSNVPFSPLLGWPPCFVDPRGGYFDPGEPCIFTIMSEFVIRTCE